MELVSITGQARTALGKKATKALRKEGLVPCVIYGGENNIHFVAKVLDFRSLLYTPDFKIAEISVDGGVYKGIVKAVQFHPVTDALLHVDFVELVPNQLIKAEVPIRLFGSSPGVKLGGKLQQSLRRAKILATPETLVDHVSAEVSHLDLGQSVRVREIVPIEGIEILNAPATPIALVEIPRALRSAKAAEEVA